MFERWEYSQRGFWWRVGYWTWTILFSGFQWIVILLMLAVAGGSVFMYR